MHGLRSAFLWNRSMYAQAALKPKTGVDEARHKEARVRINARRRGGRVEAELAARPRCPSGRRRVDETKPLARNGPGCRGGAARLDDARLQSIQRILLGLHVAHLNLHRFRLCHHVKVESEGASAKKTCHVSSAPKVKVTGVGGRGGGVDAKVGVTGEKGEMLNPKDVSRGGRKSESTLPTPTPPVPR